jgi:phenylalanyl-tRNA synthetase beta chain
MKFTLAWLKEHLETTATLDEIVVALTRNGLEVEGVDNPAEKLNAFTIAKVRSAEQHPNADKLRVCMVETAPGKIEQVVCGAPNARAGMTVVFAPPGTYVPGIDMTLKVAPIRGVESHGMMCSARELQLGDDHDGILDLSDEAPLGASYAEWAGLDDPVIEIAITPNRQDCLGVAGIARDLAASGLGTLKRQTYQAISGKFKQPIALRNEDEMGCPILLTRAVRGVKNAPSPGWMQKRLKAIGLRPISALVDITNYIMMDRGRPLHVYDLAKLKDALVVRRGRGETIRALNGKDYVVDETMTVIGDVDHIDDIAGIMGGEKSSVTDTTTDVLIECAYFDPAGIAVTGQKLGLTSDARYRFERGVDPGFLHAGMEMATSMIIEFCGGEASEIESAGTIPPLERTVTFRPERVTTLGGVDIDAVDQWKLLERLGFKIDGTDPWIVTVPSWRRDVDGEADLVEDILRMHGYDNIAPVGMLRPHAVAKPTATPMQMRQRKARRAAAIQGYTETITWSFISDKEAAPFGHALSLQNPISEDLKVMRSSLLPGLIRAAARNLDRGATSVRLFESGRRYLADGERPTLSLIATGDKSARHWQSGKATRFDVFDAKAAALALLDACGVATDKAQIMVDAPSWFHPGRSGSLKLDPRNALAHFGELHPSVLKALDIDGPVIAVEIYLDAIPQSKSTKRARSKYAPSPLQSVTRDFAFVVKDDVPAIKLLSAIKSADKDHIIDVALFDRFVGTGVEPGKVSLAVQVTYQPQIQAFTAEQLDTIAQKIIAAAIKATGAVLRS